MPKTVFAAVDISGSARKISVVSKQRAPASQSPSASLKMEDSLEIVGEGLPTPTLTRLDDIGVVASSLIGPDLVPEDFALSDYHGRNIELVDGKGGAKRVASYNQGVIVSQRPIHRGRLFQVRRFKNFKSN